MERGREVFLDGKKFVDMAKNHRPLTWRHQRFGVYIFEMSVITSEDAHP